MPMSTDLYTIAQAATVTGFCMAFMQKAVREGKLHVLKETNTHQYVPVDEVKELAKSEELTLEALGLDPKYC